MGDRSRRVLWLLQHRTLLKTEVPMLRRLGYEVFVPKIFPADMRSSTTTYEYDDSLTIPPEDLAALNAVDFYADDLSSEAVALINEHFGAACIIIWRNLHVNLFRHFTGVFLHRAFGLAEEDSYYRVLQWFGRDGLELLNAVQDRYWFTACYEGLGSVEPPLIADREVLLPLALPGSFIEANADTWTGGTRQLLFVCPDINVDDYTRDLYDHFKESYGHLPHVIVGRQSVPVEDPHVIGFVDDDDLLSLMRTSTAMIYPSHEPRHLYYHPIEAATIGLPVIFYRDSILGSMFDEPPVSAVAGDREARALAERLLDGDEALLDRVRREQHVIAEAFTEVHCERTWGDNLVASGISTALQRSSSVTAPGHGWDWTEASHLVPTDKLQMPGEPVEDRTVEEGVDLRHLNMPSGIAAVGHLGASESWGRWVMGSGAGFRLRTPVSGRLEVQVKGGTSDENSGLPIDVRLGDAWGAIRFRNWIEFPRTARTTLDVSSPTTLLTITAPRTWVDDHGRPLSISLTTLRIRPQPSPAFRAVRAAVEGGEWVVTSGWAALRRGYWASRRFAGRTLGLREPKRRLMKALRRR